tara:strand:+ start:61 stop:261 length:201 start_codon:yes stop_codon:yes gene_type:complete
MNYLNIKEGVEIMAIVEVQCPTCGTFVNHSEIGAEHIDDELYDRTGKLRWIKPKNPNQCRNCEWGS